MTEPAFLDAKGMKCPLPVLRARKAMQALPVGGLLRIEATDPGADKDFAHFCAAIGLPVPLHPGAERYYAEAEQKGQNNADAKAKEQTKSP